MSALSTSANSLPDPYVVGSEFSSLQEAKDELVRVTLSRNLSFAKGKQDDRRFVVRCRNKSCSFRLRFTPQKSGGVKTTISIPHTCPPETHFDWKPKYSAERLRRKHQETYNNDPSMKPKAIQAAEKADGNDISYKQAWATLKRAREFAFGEDNESFQQIPALLERMMMSDPTTYYHLEAKDGSFHRLFIAPGPTAEAFRYCRRFIALDGTYWRNRWDLRLLLAVARDGEDEILPLAWAIVPSESEDNWRFFLKHFKAAFREVDDETVLAVSDRAKGLEPAMRAELPRVCHTYCAQHLAENIMTTFHPGDEVRKLYWLAVKAPSKKRFDTCLERIAATKPKCKDVFEYLDKIPPHAWARHAIPLPRYVHSTSNIVESINSAWVPNIREAPVLQALIEIWRTMMTKFYERRTRKFRRSTELVDYAHIYIEEQSKKAGQLSVMPSTDHLYQVRDGNLVFTVNMEDQTCTCGEFQEMQLPCHHALAVLQYRHRCRRDLPHRTKDFVHECYHQSTYRKTYEVSFAPLDTNDLEKDENCGPCDLRKPQGRPRKKRRQHGERIYIRVNRCSACHGEGHTRRSLRCPLFGIGEYVYFQTPEPRGVKVWENIPDRTRSPSPSSISSRSSLLGSPSPPRLTPASTSASESTSRGLNLQRRPRGPSPPPPRRLGKSVKPMPSWFRDDPDLGNNLALSRYNWKYLNYYGSLPPVQYMAELERALRGQDYYLPSYMIELLEETLREEEEQGGKQNPVE